MKKKLIIWLLISINIGSTLFAQETTNNSQNLVNTLKDRLTVEGYAQIMRWVDQSGMVSNGLESIYVSQTFLTQVVLKPFSQQEPTSMSLWRTLGGVYLRNIYWRKIIEETREKYPDALFIIHAGAGHVNYTAPYTVARFFKPEETFVLEVSSRDGGLFHAYTKGGFDIEPILGWRDKDLARLVGYDVRILVPGAVTKK